jgi:molybdopterin converting factor subunit 1
MFVFSILKKGLKMEIKLANCFYFVDTKLKNDMTISILAFGIAKDIIGQHSFDMPLDDHSTVGLLKERLCAQFPAFERLRSLAIAVNEEYREDDFVIRAGDEVVIIPPVSGG